MITSNQLAAILAMDDPRPPLSVLRRHGAIIQLRDRVGEFAVTGYEAARQVLGNPRASRIAAGESGSQELSLITMSGGEHRRVRRMVRDLTDVDAMLSLLSAITPQVHGLHGQNTLSVARDIAPLVDRVTRCALFGDECPVDPERAQALVPAHDRPDRLLERSLRGGLGTQTQQLVNIVAHHCHDAKLRISLDDTVLLQDLELAYRELPAVPGIRVVVQESMRVGSVQVPSGSNVYVILLSANDDAPKGRHLTFSSGPHGCLGEQVARAQAIRVLRVLAADWLGADASILPRDTDSYLHGPSDVVLRRGTVTQ